MAPALRIPLSIPNMADFEQQMEKTRSISTSAARHIGQQFLVANREMAVGMLAGSTSLTQLATSAAQTVSPLKAIEVGAKGISLAMSGIGIAGRAAFSSGLLGAAVNFGAAMLPWIATRAAVVGAIGAVGAAIHEARRQLQEMVDVSHKATDSGVSAEFFQGFLLAARNAKIEAKDLEGALTHAFQALKDTLNPDWSVWDTGLKKVTAVEKELLNLRELFTIDQGFRGLELFRDAQTQDDKVKAILTAMTELDHIGQHLASLDLGEKMFGGSFVDKIRQGKTTAQELLTTLDRAKLTTSDHIFSNELVERTAAVDRHLKQANETLERNMRPAFEGLAEAALTIKNTWASIVDLLAKAATITEILGKPAAFRNLLQEREEIQSRLSESAYSGATAQRQLRRRLDTINTNPDIALFDARSAAREVSRADMEAMFPTTTPSGLPIHPPMPQRAPPEAKKKEEDAAETISAWDREIDRINRHTAVLAADASAVGKTAAEQAAMRAEMQLLQAAERDSDDITNEQIDAYARLRATMGPLQALQAAGIKLTDEQAESFGKIPTRVRDMEGALTRAKDAFQGINDSLRFGGNELVNVLDRATQKGFVFGQAMTDIMRNVARQMLQAAITGEGALAKLFGMNSQTGGAGGLAGLIASFFGKGGGRAETVSNGGMVPDSVAQAEFEALGFDEGGTVPPNTNFIFAEHSPKGPKFGRTGAEPLMVTPNDLTRSGGGPIIVSPIYHIDASGADPAAIMRLETALMQTNRSIESRALAAIFNARGRGSI